MKTFIGKNTDFIVQWNCTTQEYLVFYKNRQIVSPKHRFKEIESYLN